MYLQTQWEPTPHRPYSDRRVLVWRPFQKEGCEDIDSSPGALLPTQAVLKSNILRYQLLNDTPRVRESTLGEQGGT